MMGMEESAVDIMMVSVNMRQRMNRGPTPAATLNVVFAVAAGGTNRLGGGERGMKRGRARGMLTGDLNTGKKHKLPKKGSTPHRVHTAGNGTYHRSARVPLPSPPAYDAVGKLGTAEIAWVHRTHR